MGNSLNKKKLGTVIIQKGTVQDNFGKKYDIDFVGDNDDFVNISYASDKKKKPSSIKTLLSQNKNLIYDICFISNYSYLLVGCDKGNIYVYQRKNNGKAFSEFLLHFRFPLRHQALWTHHKDTLNQSTGFKFFDD